MDKNHKKHQKIKQIIFHFKESSDFIVYNLDDEGKHTTKMGRAHRTNYKKTDKIQDTSTKNQTDSEPLAYNFNEMDTIETEETTQFPLQICELDFDPDPAFINTKFFDNTEDICYPIITKNDENLLLMNNAFHPDFNLFDANYTNDHTSFF